MNIEPTTFFRKLDSAGRIIIPSKLREKYNIKDLSTLQYFIIKDVEANKCFIGFEVQESKEEQLNQLLKESGYTIEELMNKLGNIAQ